MFVYNNKSSCQQISVARHCSVILQDLTYAITAMTAFANTVYNSSTLIVFNLFNIFCLDEKLCAT